MAFYRNNHTKRMSGTIVYVQDNDINRALSMLRHISAPIIKEAKENRYYEKPSDKKRRKRKESIRKQRKRMRMQEF